MQEEEEGEHAQTLDWVDHMPGPCKAPSAAVAMREFQRGGTFEKIGSPRLRMIKKEETNGGLTQKTASFGPGETPQSGNLELDEHTKVPDSWNWNSQ